MAEQRTMEKKASYRVLVSGHRNPDIDSLASAVAVAELRRRQGQADITALCPGVLPERARYLFERFGIKPPPSRNDVYTRVRDIMKPASPISAGTTLFDAVGKLRESGRQQLPVIAADGRFLGMLSGLALLSNLLDIGNDAGRGLTGRRIHSSIQLIQQVLEAEVLTADAADKTQDFQVYVAAMNLDSFSEHLPSTANHELAVIVGDRPEIHLRVLHRRMRLMIVTGNRPVDPLIVEAAARDKVSILLTGFDSATVIRRLKFSVPVEFSRFPEDQLCLSPRDRLRDVRNRVLNSVDDLVPVVDEAGLLSGVVLKNAFDQPPPFRMILVDHNEIEQSLPGVEEIPVIEVIDHHRIGMPPTAAPIRFTADVVGSTCTLVAMMFRSAGESLPAGLAGLLLGGIVSDTLLLRSPTTAELDRRMCDWLTKIAGVQPEELMGELLRIDSPLAAKPAHDVIHGDRKDYSDGRFRFSLAQVEESNLELLRQRRDELLAEMKKLLDEEQLDFVGLLVTDAVRETSELLITGCGELIRNLPYAAVAENLFVLPGVLSRKKQLLPQILAITATLQDQG
ncbi:MAG: putative manganese-dependent inorganic diphosphatase [Lentisphaeria bacterium]|jgi:manganese-dependent inorganic pyrophosphatase